MLNRYREDTLRIGDAPNIASADHSMLRAGDMAITDGGVHCLVYVGDRKWVQADPSATKVIEVDAVDSDNYWLRHPVEFIRWRILSGE